MPTLAFYLQEETKGAPARRRCRMTAGAAAVTAGLPLSVLSGGCGLTLGCPESIAVAPSATMNEPEADAAGPRLIAPGVPAHRIVRAIGLDSAGKPRSACLCQGHLDEAIRAQFRRVLITLHSARAATP
jgi:hypothetical protein